MDLCSFQKIDNQMPINNMIVSVEPNAMCTVLVRFYRLVIGDEQKIILMDMVCGVVGLV